jgi:hypothetical protein
VLRSPLIQGVRTMAEYRAYLVDSDGHFYDVVPLICVDDAEAMASRSSGAKSASES